MALIAPQQIAITGITPTFAAATGGGDTVTPDERAFLRVKNASGGAITTTVVVPGTTYGQANPDVAVNIPATTGDVLIGPLVPALADPTTGLISITYSGVTSLTVAVVKV